MIEIGQWLPYFGQKVSLIFSLCYVFLSGKQQSSHLLTCATSGMDEGTDPALEIISTGALHIHPSAKKNHQLVIPNK